MGGLAILNRVVQGGLTEEVTSKQRAEGMRQPTLRVPGERIPNQEDSSVKASGQEWAEGLRSSQKACVAEAK